MLQYDVIELLEIILEDLELVCKLLTPTVATVDCQGSKKMILTSGLIRCQFYCLLHLFKPNVI